MSIQDRTHEFKSCVDSIRSRSAVPQRRQDVKQPFLNAKSHTKSEFSRMASSIGKDISSTTLKLSKLAQRMPSTLLCHYSSILFLDSCKTEDFV